MTSGASCWYGLDPNGDGRMILCPTCHGKEISSKKTKQKESSDMFVLKSRYEDLKTRLKFKEKDYQVLEDDFKRLGAEYEELEKKTKAACDMEWDKKLKDEEFKHQIELNNLKTKHAEQLANLKATEGEQYYKKLKETFIEMQMEGDKNSKFVQDLALKMVEKHPQIPQKGD